ncbi:MAG: NYN domain-containing protein [Chitinophagales bacterium]|nr:NYN domain-containing protein [Chitinophagales bacterium]MCZ2394085.1 NYN domain-containing protein [Chitinophagales bacterium]
MEDKRFNIAVLVDGDNAQAKLLKEIVEEVSKYGKATIRRIYGDWTSTQMNGWKNVINQYSFNPIQKFSYTTGKNSTDSSLIIDAMDILHENNVDGFCIVSSDSDYTGLAKRIREEGMFVMGIGEKKTPEAFVRSCEVFTFTDNLKEMEEEELNDKPALVTSKSKYSEAQKKSIQLSSEDARTIHKAYLISLTDEDDDIAYISQIGKNIKKIDPSFDPRSYGYGTLKKLFESLKEYQVLKNEVNGLDYPLIQFKGETDSSLS